MTEAVVLINSFEVPAEDAEQFIAAWEQTRDYLETQPGYAGGVGRPGRLPPPPCPLPPRPRLREA